jgi:hypothetical protein
MGWEGLLFTVLISVRDWSRGLASLVAPATITEIVPPWSLRSLRELGHQECTIFLLFGLPLTPAFWGQE